MSSPLDVVVAAGDGGLRGQVTLALGGEQFEVTSVTDTDEAVHAIAERLPQLLVVDLQLEGAGGLALARTVRAQPETASSRVLLLVPTGETVPADAPGVDAVLAAPFTSLALLAKVEALLDER